jgi:hypothetical protein
MTELRGLLERLVRIFDAAGVPWIADRLPRRVTHVQAFTRSPDTRRLLRSRSRS